MSMLTSFVCICRHKSLVCMLCMQIYPSPHTQTGLDSMAASTDNTAGWLRVWDLRTWRAVDCSAAAAPTVADELRWEGSIDHRRLAHSGFVSACHAVGSADGDLLLSGGADKSVRAWKVPDAIDVQQGAAGDGGMAAGVGVLWELKGHNSAISSIVGV